MLISLIAAGALCLAQDVFNPARTYVVGEKDVYGLSMRMQAEKYEATIVGKQSYEVKKVFENGDAEVESKAYDLTFSVMGQEYKQPEGLPRVIRYNKFGAAIEKDVPKDQRQPIFMSYLTYRAPAAMKLGETVRIAEKRDEDPNSEVKGTSKLESLKDGIAKVATNLVITYGKGKKPTNIESIGYFDAKSSKLDRVECKLTGLDPADLPGMPPLQSITVVIERERK
jgi:hypothetical protein